LLQKQRKKQFQPESPETNAIGDVQKKTLKLVRKKGGRTNCHGDDMRGEERGKEGKGKTWEMKRDRGFRWGSVDI